MKHEPQWFYWTRRGLLIFMSVVAFSFLIAIIVSFIDSRPLLGLVVGFWEPFFTLGTPGTPALGIVVGLAALFLNADLAN